MFCKNCGAQIADNAKFCDACGTQTAIEQATIQAQMMRIRQDNPPPYKKNAVIVTIILWVVAPVAMLVVSEGEPALMVISCAIAGAFTALAWIAAIHSHNKYMKKGVDFDISRKQ